MISFFFVQPKPCLWANRDTLGQLINYRNTQNTHSWERHVTNLPSSSYQYCDSIYLWSKPDIDIWTSNGVLFVLLRGNITMTHCGAIFLWQEIKFSLQNSTFGVAYIEMIYSFRWHNLVTVITPNENRYTKTSVTEAGIAGTAKSLRPTKFRGMYLLSHALDNFWHRRFDTQIPIRPKCRYIRIYYPFMDNFT